jgi:acetolactate synthase-1/2/3 large subunit
MAALQRLRCPVLTTYQAVGVLPEGHPQLAGLFTNAVVESAILLEADLILTVGLDQVEPMPYAWRYDVPVIAVSEVTACATLVPITVEVLGPLHTMVDRVITTTTSAWSAGAGATALASARAALAGSSTGAFGPLELAGAVIAAAPVQVSATVDAGAHFLAVMPFWPAAAPLRMLISNGLATMGFAVPAAIAVALARPGLPVVCMVGDGGLAMTLGELETLARLQLPVTVVVFDDAALSLIELKQKPGQGGSDAVRFRPVDYAQIAAAIGLDAAVVTTTAEATAALAGGWDRPRLIDARIDPSSYAPLSAVSRG